MSPENLMSRTAGRALSFDYISGGGRPEWTPEDAALACRGLSEARFAAFAYRWARDDSQRSALYDCMMRASIDLAISERWSSWEDYIERLIWIALAEERHTLIGIAHCWPVFARMELGEVRALTSPGCHIARVLKNLVATPQDESVWARLSRKYEGVRGILDNWCHDAHRHMIKRMADCEALQDSA